MGKQIQSRIDAITHYFFEIYVVQTYPEKMMEFQKNLWPTTMKIMEVSMKSSLFTIIPFILLFRWFMDFFTAIPDFRFFGFLSWFWFYLIFSIVFSSVLRKALKVV